MTSAEIKTILEEHSKWLENNKTGKCADLREVDLRGADLRWADLREVDLRGADLRWANLRWADLSGADLSKADLGGADLRGANLRGANLNGADLSEANLRWADLSRADLSRADLSEANLRLADLRGANLRGANLNGADLSEANLDGANLSRADLSEANLRLADLSEAMLNYPIACPEEGQFTGFKKAKNCIIKLEIPAEAKRSSATSGKCRCDKARVVAIENLDGSESHIAEVNSNYDKTFIYRVGEIVFVDNFDENRWNECAPGIHFFITREEAVRY